MSKEPTNQALGRWANQKINDEQRIDWDVDNNPIYIGFADRGTATNSVGWSLVKITWTSGNPTRIEKLFGNAGYTWDDRASYF